MPQNTPKAFLRLGHVTAATALLLLSGSVASSAEKKSQQFMEFRNTTDGKDFVQSTLSRYSEGGGSEIPASCPGTPQADKMILVRIRNNYKNLDRSSLVRVLEYDNSTGEGGKFLESPVQPPRYGSDRATRLDLDLKPYMNASGYVKVKVIIRDDDLTFLSQEKGITIVNDKNGYVCGRRHVLEDADDEMPDGAERESISFFVRKDPNYSTPIHFNIHVVVADTKHPAYSLPLIIDPIIKNDG